MEEKKEDGGKVGRGETEGARSDGDVYVGDWDAHLA